jgi:hypothetical protein
MSFGNRTGRCATVPAPECAGDRRVAKGAEHARARVPAANGQDCRLSQHPCPPAPTHCMTTLTTTTTKTDRRCRLDRDEAMAAHVAALVDRAPPLTPEQRDRLRRALRV